MRFVKTGAAFVSTLKTDVILSVSANVAPVINFYWRCSAKITSHITIIEFHSFSSLSGHETQCDLLMKAFDSPE